MLTAILVAVSAAIFLYFSYRYAFARPKGFPPGPPRVPLLGSYPFLMLANYKYIHKAVWKVARLYKTDIVGFHVGPFPTVAVHCAEGVREILTNSAYDGRPPLYIARMRDPNLDLTGIFFIHGPVWHEQRRFLLRFLRDFGFGRRFEEFELIVKEQITDMIELIRSGPRYEHEQQIVKSGGYRILIPMFFNVFSVNSYFHLMYNMRRSRADQADLIKLIQMGMQFQLNGDDYGKILSILPWVTKVFPKWSSYTALMEANQYLFKFFEAIVDQHMETYDESSERNFLDVYIKQMEKAKAEGDNDTTFQRSQFIMGLLDFGFPTFTNFGVTLALLIQHLLLKPEVVRRIQAEIDEVVGSGRLPTLDDRKHCHFTEAAVRESMRIETLVPSDVPHLALEDTELLGYKIPKYTVVVPSLYAYHLDKRVWGDPENFRPERFLDEEGKLCLKKDVSFPFGAGKRLCTGETFSRNLLFLMTSAICQNFNLISGPDDKVPDPSKNLIGFINTPPDFWLHLEERST